MSVVLRTPRLTLRPPERRDIERVEALISDFEVAKMLAVVPHPYTRADAEAWFSAAETSDPAERMAFVIDPGEGAVGAFVLRELRRTADIGFWLGQPYWGLGYMTEAAIAILSWLFETTDHDRVTAGAFADNPASIGVQKKLGFVVCGESRHMCRARGQELPHIDLVLTRDNFMTARARAGANRA